MGSVFYMFIIWGVDPDSALFRPPSPLRRPPTWMPPVTAQPMAMEQMALGCSAPHGPSSTARRRSHSWRPIVRADAADLVSLSIRQKVLPGLFLLPLHIARLLPGSLSTTRPHDATTPHRAPSTTRSDDNHQLPT